MAQKRNSKGRELFTNAFTLGISKLASPVLSFLLVPLYTSHVAPGEYGAVDIIQTYAALLIPIALLRLDIGIFRFIVDVRKDQKEVSRIFTNAVFIAAPIFALSLFVIGLFGVLDVIPFISTVLLYSATQIIGSMLDPLVRGLGRNRLFTITALTSAAFNLVFGYVFVAVLGLGSSGILLAGALSSLVRTLIMVLAVGAHKMLDVKLISHETRKELIKFSAPLTLDGVSFWVINMSDRTMIAAMIGLAANGIYAISNKFSNIVSTATTIFWMAWSEMTAKYVNTKEYKKIVTAALDTYLRLLFVGVGVFLALIPIVWNVFVGAEFRGAYTLVPILVIANALNAVATFYAPIYTARKQSKQISASTMIGAVVNLVLNSILIPVIGIYGAAIATVIAYLVILIYRAVDIKKKEGVSLNWKFCIMASVGLCIIIWSYYSIEWGGALLAVLNMVFATIYLLVISRRIWQPLLRKAVRTKK